MTLVEGLAVPEETQPKRKVKKFACSSDTPPVILQMNLRNTTFFVFNSKTDTINVVYKRKHGKYGLIEWNIRLSVAPDRGAVSMAD